MNPAIKKTISILIVAGLVAVAIYGSILPYRKSGAFIEAMRRLNSAKSLDEFKTIMSRPLEMTSPIGQDELVRNLASVVTNLVERNGQGRPEFVASVIEYLQGYYDPIISYGKGPSFSQNLYVLGILNEIAFLQTQDKAYLAAAKNYFSRGHELGPRRPQFLYGLFDVYRAEGDTQKAVEIANQILTYWPNDTQIKSLLGGTPPQR